MRLPLEIRALRLALPEDVEDEIRQRAAKLERFYERIMGCRVTVEGPGPHHRRGRCAVKIDLTVPGKEIVVTRQSGVGLAETLRKAFDAADRRVEDHVRKSRGRVKRHELREGRVIKLFSTYGFIQAPDGRETYFHRNSVAERAQRRLKIGTRVRYEVEEGEDGPQATRVRPPRRRRASRALR